MIQQIDHIAIAVSDLDEAAAFFAGQLGLEVGGIETVEEQKTKVAFIQVGQVRIELVQPTEPDSPVGKFIAKRGEGIHHIALRTDGIEQELSGLADKGVRLIDKEPKVGAHDARIAFVHPKSSHGVLLELCQPSK
ncbi:MAG: methylmalonyl-CoA epimerase [Deltaproteobacteria bacterium]|nr:methylmalonyl-CoA epimerase [Deltaproteobacteria bacterium]